MRLHPLRELKQTLPIAKAKTKIKKEDREGGKRGVLRMRWRGARPASFFRTPEMPQGQKVIRRTLPRVFHVDLS